MCEEGKGSVDAVLVDNLDLSYALFKRAAVLQHEGAARKVLVASILAGPDGIAARIAELMARSAKLHDWTTIPIRETEPISLNAAMQVREVLAREGVRSVALVTPGFRSRRSSLVYEAVLRRDRVLVRCVPVFERHSVDTWSRSWHGIQEVGLQFVKLQYYRFYVLPMRKAAEWRQAPPSNATESCDPCSDRVLTAVGG